MHQNARLTPKGREISIKRLQHGERLDDVACAMGVSTRTVYKWRRPEVGTVLTISAVFRRENMASRAAMIEPLSLRLPANCNLVQFFKGLYLLAVLKIKGKMIMEFPEFIGDLHALDLPFPPEMVKTHVIRSDRGLMVIFDILQDIAIPTHSHLGQWGTVLVGCLELTIDGQTTSYKPGESYNIPSGVEHAAKVHAGSKLIDIFEEPDRYPLKT